MMIRERKAGGSPPPPPAELTQGGGGWWKQRRSTMGDAPPLPLIALFGIVLFYLYLSAYLPFKEDLHRGGFFLKVLFFVLLPTLLFFLIRSNYTTTEDGSSPSTRRWYDIRVRRSKSVEPVAGYY
uniref:Uncharacterized protein n=1 Tax=Opuntia streptacantha TaxID=393608 RepID=A0A7C9ABK9_OPUST